MRILLCVSNLRTSAKVLVSTLSIPRLVSNIQIINYFLKILGANGAEDFW